jgi:hypothetical protein
MKAGPFFNRRSKPAPPVAGPEAQRKPLATTLTGELVQPVRLHYKLLNKDAVIEAIEKLGCVDAVHAGKAYKWYLSNETKGAFKPGTGVPKGESIILGDILVGPKPNQLCVLVRSIERALYALEFFDKNIGRTQMEVTELDAYNQLFEASPENQQRLANLTALFPEAQITKQDVDAIPNLIKKAKKAGASQAELQQAVMAFIEKGKDTPLPDIERMSLYFYTEGIASIQSKLFLRQRVALEHLKGNTRFTIFDAIKGVVHGK